MEKVDITTQESIAKAIIDNNDAVNKSTNNPSAGDGVTDDMWLLTLSYLGNEDRLQAALVCRRWNELARLSWKSITCLSFRDNLKPRNAEQLEMKVYFLGVGLWYCGTRLRRLDLMFFPRRFLVPHFLNQVVPHSSSLQELDLSSSNIDGATLQTVSKRLPRLRSLVLRNCKRIDDNGLGSALATLQGLESLSVPSNNVITGECFSEAAPSLMNVNMNKCANLTDNGVYLLAQRCTDLQTIDITACENLTSKSTRVLGKNCPKLKRLKGISCWQRNTASLLTLSSLSLLEELHMYDHHHHSITDQVFCELSRHCLRITTIFLRGSYELNSTTNPLDQFSPWLHLQAIDLSYCRYISDKWLIHFSSCHSELKKVHLKRCRNITDKGVGSLVWDHPNLLELDVSFCNKITDNVVPALEASLHHRKQTRSLKICLVRTAITPTMVSMLTENTRCTVKSERIYKHAI